LVQSNLLILLLFLVLLFQVLTAHPDKLAPTDQMIFYLLQLLIYHHLQYCFHSYLLY